MCWLARWVQIFQVEKKGEEKCSGLINGVQIKNQTTRKTEEGLAILWNKLSGILKRGAL